MYNSKEEPKNVMYHSGGVDKVVNEKEKEPLVDNEKDTGYSSSKINEGYTNPYSYKDKKAIQPLKKEKDNDELNIYIKKGYGKVKDSDNLTSTNPNNSDTNTNKDQYTKYSSEKRQYRPQGATNLISIEDNSSERNKEIFDYSNKYMTNQLKSTIDIPNRENRGGYSSDLGYSSIPMNDLRNQNNISDPVNPNMKKGYTGYKGIGSGMNLPYDKSQYQFSKKDFGSNYY